MSVRGVVLLCVALVAVAWGVVGYRSSSGPRPSPPAVTPRGPSAELPPDLLGFCEGLEVHRSEGCLDAVLAAVFGLTSRQRELLAERAVAHALSSPGDSPYLPVLVKLRSEARPALERAMRDPSRRETAFGLWAQATLVNGYRAWCADAQAADRAVLSRALVERLDQPEDRDGAEVRTLALGFAVRLFDRALLPELRQLDEREPNLNTRWTAHRLLEALEGRNVKGPRRSGVVPPPEAPPGSGS